MVHVAPHFSLCAPAYGRVGEQIAHQLERIFKESSTRGLLAEGKDQEAPREVVLVRTKMALGGQTASEAEQKLFQAAGIKFLETNEDLDRLVDHLILQPATKGIVMAAAVCDWQPECFRQDRFAMLHFGKSKERLRTSAGTGFLTIAPSDKIIGKIRQRRKDIFLVGFKATTGMEEQEQYITGLGLLKNASCNLVFANDVHEHVNMVITPEEAKYHVTKDRKKAIKGLCEMIAMRSQLRFTRSTVIDGDPIAWDSNAVPDNLRKVVNHLIARGAYKPFQGKTVGHFATRGPKDGIIYTSRRKTDFNKLPEEGLLRIDTVGDDQVIAHGAKPSVGGQSQRIIFDQHSDVDCIVHAHVPLREGPKLNRLALQVRPQRPFECGSHQCGLNASEGLSVIREGIKAVMLDEHGPNICFSKTTDPDRVIDFIEEFWDLEKKTGGPVSLGV